MNKKVRALQIRIDLKGSKPAIWRRINIPAYFTFAQFHDVIQTLFGWGDLHSFEFSIPAFHMVLQSEIYEEDEYFYPEASKVTHRAGDVIVDILKEGSTCTYVYDFEDKWVHSIKVENIVEQEEYYPKLIKWKGDNACEDIGGIQEYYRVLPYLEKNDHPYIDDFCAWFERKHIIFDEADVQEGLLETVEAEEFLDDTPIIDAMYDLLDMFDYIYEDSLFELKIYENKPYYIWFHEGEHEKNIRIYMDAYDCAISSLYEQEQEHIHPLFTNGVVLEYPKTLEDEEEDINKYSYHCYGNMETDDFLLTALVCSIRDVVCNVLDEIVDEVLILPDAHEEQRAVRIHVTTEGKVDVTFSDIEMQMVKEKANVDNIMPESIADKENRDTLFVCIVSIPNLLHDEIEDDIVYALVLKGQRMEQFILFEHMDISYVGDFIVEHLFAYMNEEGKPEHVYCNDERIRQILRDVCKSIKLPLDYRCLDNKIERNIFAKALEKQNPPELYDENFMMNAEELIKNETDENEIARLLHKIRRYMAYQTFVQIQDKK